VSDYASSDGTRERKAARLGDSDSLALRGSRDVVDMAVGRRLAFTSSGRPWGSTSQ